jgi:hypothetical protein
MLMVISKMFSDLVRCRGPPTHILYVTCPPGREVVNLGCAKWVAALGGRWSIRP